MEATAHHSAYEELQPIHPEPISFWRRYIFSTDHKVIAKQFLWSGLIFLFIGGTLAMMIRWQWAFPGAKVPVLGSIFLRDQDGRIGPATYMTIFTMHGLIMIFFAITPVLIGAFGNFCIPLMIGARDMAFPKLNLASFWAFVISLVLVICSFFGQLGAAGAGWTTYPPLSTNIGTPGSGQTFMVAAIFVTGVSTIMGGINYVTTVIRHRAPGMGYMRMPLTVWGLWLTAILNVLFVPVLGSAALLLFLDRVFGTQFFIAGAAAVKEGGDPILFQHLFWIFGHPEVYILILPAWGIVSDILSFFSRKPANWYRGSVYAMCSVTGLSAVVYGHHMFMTGMNPLLGQGFMLLTLIISVPAEVLFLNWLRTIWQGSIRLTPPMLFALGMVFVFGAGGLTGLYLGAVAPDIYLHDTMFVVGHFHLTMAAASFLGSLAAIYYWFPKMFGRQMNQRLGTIHFWWSVVFISLVFFGQLLAGYAGQSRRLYDPYQYSFLKHLLPLNRYTSYSAFILMLGQLIFVYNFVHGVFAGEKAEANPWRVGTLEWFTSSPPPHHNYDVIPTVVRGPHEFADPDVRARLGRDWIGQAEKLPQPTASAPAIGRA
ncbi:MAG TPA: cbb3-type cytochrome c oxidase subunit I [Myxococcales bacterium]|nr:cbb3-type cytochrome c oxidase subunit I [Myxococcales bacterium]